MKTDIEIAHSVEMKPIKSIAKYIGLSEDDLEMYGEYKAKIKLEAIEKFKKQRGELVLVSAITPTPAGEGKTTTSIGLSMALNRMGKKSIVTLREPSLGPLFGMKGGATGGGYAQVLPMEDINLHFTGDMHAVTTAHNLISAVVDNHIFRRKEPLIDPRRIMWNRVMDMNDRALRNMVIGLGGRKNGVPRETSFQITASSEIMAILCLAESYPELKDMISNILIGLTYSGEPVYVKDLKVEGAVTALLKDAIKPNLVQTTENTPAFVHGGPFANIAQGTCSVLSMKLGLSLSDIVVTEAGFGFDLGAEKFFDIVARKSGLKPRVVVLVATVRALKMHGGKDIKKGLPNLEKHIENIKKFGLPPVVAINRFPSDTREELNVIKAFCSSKGVDISISEVHSKGGDGAIELAEMVLQEMKKQREYTPLYSLELPVKEKIEAVSREIYGSRAVDFTRDGKIDLKLIEKLGLENLPVCIAKTQKSLSDNPKLLGRPKDFLVTVRRITISSGAGFLVPITGDILLMPGLPHKPVAETVDIDNEGNIKGLF